MERDKNKFKKKRLREEGEVEGKEGAKEEVIGKEKEGEGIDINGDEGGTTVWSRTNEKRYGVIM